MFLTRAEYAEIPDPYLAGCYICRDSCGVEQLTKLDEFSGKSKQMLMICSSRQEVEERFADFCAGLNFVSAAGGLVSTPSGDVLMIFRNGRWDLPKGKKEGDETPEECAVREVMEECSIDGLTLGEFLCDTYHIYAQNDRWTVKQTSWFSMCHNGEGNLVPQRIEGITKVRWVPRKGLGPYLAGTYATVRDVFAAARIL